MSIYIILLAAIALMVILIRKKVPIGPAILAGGLLIWLANLIVKDPKRVIRP